MKNMKLFISLVLAVVLCVAMVGCASRPTNGEGWNDPNKPDEQEWSDPNSPDSQDWSDPNNPDNQDWSDPENLEEPVKLGYDELLGHLLDGTNFAPYNTRVTFDENGKLIEFLYSYSPWN